VCRSQQEHQPVFVASVIPKASQFGGCKRLRSSRRLFTGTAHHQHRIFRDHLSFDRVTERSVEDRNIEDESRRSARFLVLTRPFVFLNASILADGIPLGASSFASQS
jgi:hypothetical protein